VKRPYTRQSSKKPRKGYVKGVPDSKIHKFEIGDPKKAWPLRVSLVAKSAVQIRNNALEAARVAANKILDRGCGPEGYFLKILVFPHHVLRENALATGAGADRFQSGMRLSFGNPIGTAAQVKAGQALIEVRTDAAKLPAAKEALKVASSKLPTPCTIVAA
jgi:large subunit ribosomal protein L10e